MSAAKVKQLAALTIGIMVVLGALKIISWAKGPTGGDAAAALVCADRPTLTGLFELPIVRTGGDNANSDTPQFNFGPAGTVYEARYPDLRAVDFANLTYRPHGIAPDLSIPLRNGAYDARDGVGFERAGLLDTTICDGPAAAVPLAIVRLRYASGAGSSTCDEIVQVFGLRDGRLAALHEIVYACAPGGTYAVDCRRGTVTATATAWLGSDPHCCPLARDTAVFSFLGEVPRLLSWTRDPANPVK